MGRSGGRRAVAAVMAGLMGIGGCMAPMNVVLVSPSVAFAGTAVSEADYGSRIVAWCEPHATDPGKSIIVRIRVDGLGPDSIRPDRLVDTHGNEFVFDDSGEVSVQIIPLTGSGYSLLGGVMVMVPVTEDPDDWKLDENRDVCHKVDGAWELYSDSDPGNDITYDLGSWAMQRLQSYASSINGVDGSFFDYESCFGVNYYEHPTWVMRYSDGGWFDAFKNSWSDDMRGMVRLEENKAICDVPDQVFVESDVNGPYVGEPTGSGSTSLGMVMGDVREHGGYGVDPSNPDELGGGVDGSSPDGLGDNLAFTVPSSINYVVKADGTLVGPSDGAAYIENRSAFPAHVSSLDIDEAVPFSIVDDARSSAVANAVDLLIGPSGGGLNAVSYLEKTSIGADKVPMWNMSASTEGVEDQVALSTSGHVSNVSVDVTTSTKFGEVHWFVTPGEAERPVLNMFYGSMSSPGPIGSVPEPREPDREVSLVSGLTGPVLDGSVFAHAEYLSVNFYDARGNLLMSGEALPNDATFTWESLGARLRAGGNDWSDMFGGSIEILGYVPTSQEI